MQENVYFEGGNFKNLQHLRGHIPPQTPPCVAQVRRNQRFALIVHQASKQARAALVSIACKYPSRKNAILHNASLGSHSSLSDNIYVF